MKKWSMFFLAALLLLTPLSGLAEELPDFLSAVSQGLSEGLQSGASVIAASSQELTLALTAEDTRIEEGHTLTLTVIAGNPYPQETPITLTLDLPDRLSCAQPLTWEAQLEAAVIDPASGNLVPSVATFTREVTLTPGGESEQAAIEVEMSMGTRFYRAAAALDLCVPDVSASAEIVDADNQLASPGDAFVYQIQVVNDGTAPKDVTVQLLLPDGAAPAGALPTGFALQGRTVRGAVRAEIASASVVRLPMQVEEDALDGDEDASRLLSGSLTVDGVRVATPRLRVVGPMISAKLIPQLESLEEGGEMDLSITVVNTGLAAADVEISCLLPEGLTVLKDLTKEKKEAFVPAGDEACATQGEAATDDEPPLAPAAEDDGLPPDAAAEPVMTETTLAQEMREEDGALVYSIRMDAAQETESGLAAATQEIRLRVRADMPPEEIEERLLGATLAWRTDEGETRLGEAVALRVYRSGFLGMSDAEWNGVLLAALLMMVTVCCLYSAVKADSRPEEYCFE